MGQGYFPLCEGQGDWRTEKLSSLDTVTSEVTDIPTPEGQSNNQDPGYLNAEAEHAIGIPDAASSRHRDRYTTKHTAELNMFATYTPLQGFTWAISS